MHRLERRYPFFIAHTSSRASPTLFRLLQPRPRLADLCRLLPVLAECGAFPTLSLRAYCLDVWTSATVGYGVLLLVTSSISSAFPNG